MATKKGRVTGSTQKARKPKRTGTLEEKLVGAIFGKVASSPVPTFSEDAPPADWERQHRAPRGRIIVGVPSWNQGAMPVPRQASAHYYRPSETLTTFYFY